VIVKGAGAMVHVRLALAVCAGEPESVTLNATTAALAAAVGVPLIKPVNEFRARPAGSVPEATAHV